MENKLIYEIKKYEDEVILKSNNKNNRVIYFSYKDEKYQNGVAWYYNCSFDKNVVNIDIPLYLFHSKLEFNYEHWLRDTIFLLEGYIRLKKDIPNLKLLRCSIDIPNKNINNNFQLDTLKLLFGNNIDDYQIMLKTDETYLVKELYIPLADYHLFSTSNDIPYEIQFMINLLIEKAKPFSKNDYPKKIYLSRRNLQENNLLHNRIIVNEDEIAELMIQNGYIEIFSDELSFTDEINLFNNVEKVVTPIGAGCANLFFANKYSNWCIISHPNHAYTITMKMCSKETVLFNDSEILENPINENCLYKVNIDSLRKFLKEKDFI